MASSQKEVLKKLKEHLEAMKGEYVVDDKLIDLGQQAFGWNKQKGLDEMKQQIKWEASRLLIKVNDLTSKLEKSGITDTLKDAAISSINPWHTPEYEMAMKVIQEDFEAFLLNVHAFELFVSALFLEESPERNVPQRNVAGPVQSTVKIAASAVIWMMAYKKLHEADLIRVQINIVQEIRFLNIFNIEVTAGPRVLSFLTKYKNRPLRFVGRFSAILLPLCIGIDIFAAVTNKQNALDYLREVNNALRLCLKDS